MLMILNGSPIDVTDDSALVAALERNAAITMGAMNKVERIQTLERLLVQSKYLAAKFGALAAQIKAKPDLPVDVQLVFEFADALGQMAGFNYSFSTEEVRNVEVEEDTGGLGVAADAERNGECGGSAG